MRLFHCTWKAVLGHRLPSPICAFHLGFSLDALLYPLHLDLGQNCLQSGYAGTPTNLINREATTKVMPADSTKPVP